MLTKEKEEIKKYTLGIIAPRGFQDLQFLHSLIGENIFKIDKICTNNVVHGGDTVQIFSKNLCIPYMVYPICAGTGGIFASNQQIINNSEFVYLIDDGQSHNLKNAESQCVKSGRKHRIVPYSYVKEGVLDRIKELIGAKKLEIEGGTEKTIKPEFLDKILEIVNDTSK